MEILKDEYENRTKIQIKVYNNGRYEGQLKQDKMEGQGKYYFKNGDIYEGEFKNNKREGKGIYYMKNGNKYEGDFKNDKKEG